ncbi:phage virion morphogenesis protein [Pseudomonas brassicacearum]|uniref:Phage virion morphogenesis protein n=1 Tax=Pseudomonas brassicacearum TaxID=930166 RepID=A0A423G4U5_9PSED|nr:phage virion morphogenesis protein [Pseudomonas brassicacearum]ROM80509.1 phage virion morphogenesis protein [Pseudomonas brassicacearum]
MNNDLQVLETWVAALLTKLDEGERRKLLGAVARDLRRSQSKRITTQRNPDGSAFAARKPKDLRGKQGRIKSKMFTKLKSARYMRTQSTADRMSVGFVGRVSRIARVHQYGLKDRPERGQADVQYEARQLLGFSGDELDNIRNMLIDHLTA